MEPTSDQGRPTPVKSEESQERLRFLVVEAARLRSEDGHDSERVLDKMGELGQMLCELGQACEALPVFRKLAESMQRLYGPHHLQTVGCLVSLAGCLAASQDHAEAVVVLRDCRSRCFKMGAVLEPEDKSGALTTSGKDRAATQLLARAITALSVLVAAAVAWLGYWQLATSIVTTLTILGTFAYRSEGGTVTEPEKPNTQTLSAALLAVVEPLAQLNHGAKDFEGAAAYFHETALSTAAAYGGTGHPRYAVALCSEGRSWMERSVQLREGSDHIGAVACVRRAEQRLCEASILQQRGLHDAAAASRSNEGAELAYAKTQLNLATCYHLLDQTAQAAPLFATSAEIMERHLGPEHPRARQAREAASAAASRLGKEVAEPMLVADDPGALFPRLEALRCTEPLAGGAGAWWRSAAAVAEVAASLEKRRFAVLDGFVGAEAAATLRAACLAATGSLLPTCERTLVPRSDEVAWEPSGFEPLTERADDLLVLLRARCPQLAAITSRQRLMFARYRTGAHFGRHVDNNCVRGHGPQCNPRVLTAVYYMQDGQWDARADGGCLRLYAPDCADGAGADAGTVGAAPETGRGVALYDVAPVGDRLVLFFSDQRCPHEVLPVLRAGAERFAATLWYMGGGTVPEFWGKIATHDSSLVPLPSAPRESAGGCSPPVAAVCSSSSWSVVSSDRASGVE